jgi:intraflagellar transport protein 81
MTDLQLIVERLNVFPFGKGITQVRPSLSLPSSLAGSQLTLPLPPLPHPPSPPTPSLQVSLDDRSPTELLQLLNDVFAELDKAHRVDVRDEAPEAAGPRMVSFLQVLKFPGAAESRSHEALSAALCRGDRSAIYPVLAYVLPRMPALKKRAYVARYLLPVEVPAEFQHDEAVSSLLAEYKALQGDFKNTHKGLERAQGGSKATPGELKKEISQLEDERGQLIEKIAALKKKTGEIKGFGPQLEATSSLRKEQEEEGRLAERMQEQRASLAAAERRYAEVNHRLAHTRAGVREDITSGEAVLGSARKEAEEARALVSRALPASIVARKETLARLHRMLAEPAKSEAALSELRSRIGSLEAAVSQLSSSVAGIQRASGDDKLAMFRQQSALVAKKLAQREEALEALSREAEAVGREVEAREAKLSELSGPKYMKREEFKAYAAALRSKTSQFKSLKAALSEVRQETVVLARTEALLKARAGDMDAFLRKLEERKGIGGYSGVASDLEKVSALKSRIDESKGATLQEISRIVEDIKSTIGEQKTRLVPQIKALRALRSEFTEAEAQYLLERATYESVAVGLEAEKAALERQADALQAEATSEEAKLQACELKSLALEALAERAKEEAAFEAGEGRLLRDFRTHKDLFAHRASQVRPEGACWLASPSCRAAACAPHSSPLTASPLILLFSPPSPSWRACPRSSGESRRTSRRTLLVMSFSALASWTSRSCWWPSWRSTSLALWACGLLAARGTLRAGPTSLRSQRGPEGRMTACPPPPPPPYPFRVEQNQCEECRRDVGLAE